MSSPWWAAFGPVEAQVACGPGQHSVRWSDGTLQPLEHADAEAELVLAALGGDATPCLGLVRAWARHCDDLVVLALAPRSADDALTVTTAEIDELSPRGSTPQAGAAALGSERRSRRAVAVRPPAVRPRDPLRPGGESRSAGAAAQLVLEGDQGRHELLRLLALSAPLQLRLSGAVTHAWSAWGPRAARAGRARPALTAALTGRVAPTAARWLGLDLTQIDAALYAGPGWGTIELESTDEIRLKVRLPVSWLAWVWAPGLAVVDGHFVVSVQHAAWPTAQVVAISAPGRDPVDLTVRHEKGGWAVVRR